MSETKWKIRDLGILLKNTGMAILRGELLLRLGVSRYFMHILVIFALLAGTIWVSLGIETTLGKVEENRKALKELEIAHSQKTFELAEMSRRTTIEKMLQEMGSDLAAPQQSARVLVEK